MPRAKRYSEVRRSLLRHLPRVDDSKLAALRDELWDLHIARKFKAGNSVDQLSMMQPDRRSAEAVESAIRRRLQRQTVG